LQDVNLNTLTNDLLGSRETERDWDKELAEEVRGECEDKYGPVVGIKVEKETQVCCCLLSTKLKLIPFVAGRDICQV
jgi:hypothetical protein